MSSEEMFNPFDCVTCRCNYILVVRNHGTSLTCSMCNNRIKRRDISRENMEISQKRIIENFVCSSEKVSDHERLLLKIEKEIELNKKDKSHLQKMRKELEDKESYVKATESDLIQKHSELVEKINKEKARETIDEESGIRSPEIKQNPVSKKRKLETGETTSELKEELEFYKSVFKSHRNSLVSQVKIKTMNGNKVWVDHIREDKKFIEALDRDEEVEEWLKPVKCER
tara:strand:- start:971 stop:1654 length:684 start_codon:yes stop_codon:yes gene_type:complete